MDALSALPFSSSIEKPAREKQASEVAQQFEAFFIGQMMESMSVGLKTDGPFGGGGSERTWRSLQNQEYGRIVAQDRGIGIAEAIYNQILKLQEAEAP